MQDKRNLHKKMQEQVDCYGGTDYLTELGRVKNEPDKEQAPLKWLALAVLYGINENAEKIKLERSDDGKVRITAVYRDAELPSPGDDVVERIIDDLRQITHIDTDKGETPLSVGVRDSSIDLKVKIKRDGGKDKIVLKFPEK